MKMLKKLALVSAISAISVSAFALEAMDEDTMSATTGQDGITINIVPDRITYAQAASMGVSDATMAKIAGIAGYPSAGFKGLSIGEIRVHDDDGYGILGTSATANSGALVIGGVAVAEDLNGDGDMLDAGELAGDATRTEANRTVLLAKGDKPIQINVDMIGDANATAGNQAMLRVEIKQPKIALKLGNIYVANSNAAEAGYGADGTVTAGSAEVDGTTVSDKVKILSGLEIVMAESNMIIRLGNEDSSNNMITADAQLLGGLTINNFELFDESGASALTADNLLSGDVGSGGSFRAKSISILNSGAATDGTGVLDTKTGIDIGSRVTVSTVSASARDGNFGVGTAVGVFDSLNANPSLAGAYTNFGLTDSSTDANVAAALTQASTIVTAIDGVASATMGVATANADVTTANADVTTATTGLATARDTQAALLFSGSTYAALSAGDKATVDGTTPVTTANGTLTTANTTLTTANTTLATANTTLTTANNTLTTANTGLGVAITDSTTAKGAVKAVTLLATGTQGRIATVNGAADGVNTLTETNTWGGVDTYNGLVITSQLGNANGADIRINNIALGDANAKVMGDVEILGLKLGASKIVIMGH